MLLHVLSVVLSFHMSLLELKRKRFKCYFANPMKIKDQERMFISLLVYAAKALLRTAH
jgi:hypothetical protein